MTCKFTNTVQLCGETAELWTKLVGMQISDLYIAHLDPHRLQATSSPLTQP